MDLVVSPCRQLCSWSAVRPALLECAGCGSQWEPGQAWRPRQADGTVPAAVLALSAASAGGAGSAGS